MSGYNPHKDGNNQRIKDGAHFDITMRITKSRAHFVTNYVVMLMIILLLFKFNTVVARGGGGGHGGGGGGGAHGGGRGHGGGRSHGGGGEGRGGHGEEEGGRGIGGAGGMVHRPRPLTRSGDSALNPFAGVSSTILLIIVFLFN
ncbi:hypothetical protein Bca4012_079692 [Brassica carinata]